MTQTSSDLAFIGYQKRWGVQHFPLLEGTEAHASCFIARNLAPLHIPPISADFQEGVACSWERCAFPSIKILQNIIRKIRLCFLVSCDANWIIFDYES